MRLARNLCFTFENTILYIDIGMLLFFVCLLPMKKWYRWFTLIEMIIVAVIIGVLATALVPRIQHALARVKNSKRMTDLHTVYNGTKIYIMDYAKLPGNATALEWPYLTSLPSDPSGLKACVNYRHTYPVDYYTAIMQRDYSSTLDAHNYYPGDKWYYYNELQTGMFIPGRWSASALPIAVLGAYMERVGITPVSNVPNSHTKIAMSPWWRGSSCAEYAIWSTYAMWWYGTYAVKLPSPEAINTPEVLPILQIMYGGAGWGTSDYYSMWPTYFNLSEGDYLMMVTK